MQGLRPEPGGPRSPRRQMRLLRLRAIRAFLGLSCGPPEARVLHRLPLAGFAWWLRASSAHP
eukprot:3966347-Pyramimonas_sp.AAC.1